MELKESMHPKPQSDEDALTVELRNEFALLNRIFELREIARDTSKNKLNRKASRAAIKHAKKSGKKLGVTPKKALLPAKLPDGEWIKKTCWRCNSRFSIHSTWDRPPSMCKACAKDIDETYLPSAPDRSKPAGWVHIVSGGAPGMGKRR
ncbi:hypothetical protein ACQJ22_01150 [Pseudomonas fragariae (ex Marin et al. 2024)]|uniref:hypothetical protein n=1 Tax=Pseudomonas TaxID=286 RepID=UPI00044594F4|nr:hypothetical protein [Pseudomonas syringae]AKF46325.1 hypothetical protein PsyrB_14210 [Pseudomonas syringae pv. syringae B301D]EXL31160.1 hypothetical protein PssB301D_02453 [Pseudomonas syringae pv. syringae str. B301D-R]